MKKEEWSKKSRRFVGVTALLIVVTLLLGACGSSEASGSSSGSGAGSGDSPVQPFTLDVAVLGERLHNELEYRDQLEELEPEIVYTMLGIDASDVAAQKNYISSGATAEEIILFQAVDKEAAVRLKDALAVRCQDQQDVYASYAPEEVGYLQQSVLMDRENYVVFCVPVDGQAAEKMIKEALDLK